MRIGGSGVFPIAQQGFPCCGTAQGGAAAVLAVNVVCVCIYVYTHLHTKYGCHMCTHMYICIYVYMYMCFSIWT